MFKNIPRENWGMVSLQEEVKMMKERNKDIRDDNTRACRFTNQQLLRQYLEVLTGEDRRETTSKGLMSTSQKMNYGITKAVRQLATVTDYESKSCSSADCSSHSDQSSSSNTDSSEGLLLKDEKTEDMKHIQKHHPDSFKDYVNISNKAHLRVGRRLVKKLQNFRKQKKCTMA